MAQRKRKADLNIYLLKTGMGDYSESVRMAERLTAHPVSVGGVDIGTLYVQQTHPQIPPWTGFFDGVVAAKEFGKNSSAGALLAVGVDGRIFLLAFGRGRHLISSEFIESNFGFRVTLNCVKEDSLRSIDKASFEAHPRHSREQSGQAAALQNFTVDVERDLLRALTGTPTDPALGERISGMDSVKLSLDIALPQVPELLSRLLKEYISDAYKRKGFAFVDHIAEVKDTVLRESLDAELLGKVNASDFDKMWLAFPGIIDWDQVVGFKYSPASDAPRVHDVRLGEFIGTLGGREIDKTLLLRRKIICVDADDLPVNERAAYYYIYAELASNGKTYVLNNGSWYLVDFDFVEQVNKYFRDVPRYQRVLPDYEDLTEDQYNRRVAESNSAEYALLDRKNVLLPGALSPVEPCDLYHCARELIHVKRYSGSSLLSHLFNQGVVSGELFRRERLFRAMVNDKLPDTHKIPDVDLAPKQNEYKIVYAIVSEFEEPLSIPFFSKISLRHAVNRLTDIGFQVELGRIAVSDTRKKTNVYPSMVRRARKRKAPPGR